MSNARLNACVVIVVSYLVEKETRSGHLQKKYAGLYGK